MKKRRLVVVSFLLVAALAIGIGYAAVTDELKISGEIAIDANAIVTELEDDVYFSDAKVLTNASNLTASATLSDDVANKPDTAYMTLDGFTQIDQVVVFQYAVTNDSTTKPVKVTLAVDEGSGAAYYDIVTSWKDAGNVATIAAGQTVTVDITVNLLHIPNDALSVTDFSVTLSAEYAE